MGETRKEKAETKDATRDEKILMMCKIIKEQSESETVQDKMFIHMLNVAFEKGKMEGIAIATAV